MSDTSPSISGAGLGLARSFPCAVPTTTGADPTALAAGGYTIRSTVDCWLKLGTDSGATGRAAVPSTVAAAGSQPAVNRTIFVPADETTPFDVWPTPSGTTVYFSLIVDTGSAGTARINGPFSNATGLK